MGLQWSGRGRWWADVQQLQGVCLRETHIPEQSCSYQTHKPDSFVTTTGQKEQSQDWARSSYLLFSSGSWRRSTPAADRSICQLSPSSAGGAMRPGSGVDLLESTKGVVRSRSRWGGLHISVTLHSSTPPFRPSHPCSNLKLLFLGRFALDRHRWRPTSPSIHTHTHIETHTNTVGCNQIYTVTNPFISWLDWTSKSRNLDFYPGSFDRFLTHPHQTPWSSSPPLKERKFKTVVFGFHTFKLHTCFKTL